MIYLRITEVTFGITFASSSIDSIEVLPLVGSNSPLSIIINKIPHCPFFTAHGNKAWFILWLFLLAFYLFKHDIFDFACCNSKYFTVYFVYLHVVFLSVDTHRNS